MTWAQLNVFEYMDYRRFLRELYARRKGDGSGFSLRAFSRRAALRSPNYLKLVMDGDRNLSSEMASRFAQACGLKDDARSYFCELVAFNQARAAAEKNHCYARLRRFRKHRQANPLEPARAAYHSNWYVPAIRELALRDDFQEDPRWIARTLVPQITPRDAAKALSILVELRLLVRNDRGILEQAEPLLTTGEGPQRHHIANYHRAMMERAAESLDHTPRHLREISSLTLCVSEEGLQRLKTQIGELRRGLLQASMDETEPTRVVQINFQLFPLSTGKAMGGKRDGWDKH